MRLVPPILANSISNKTIALTCLLTLLTGVIVGGISYLHAIESAKNSAFEKLFTEAKLSAFHLQSGYEEMANDAFLVANTPPIQGIIRSTTHNDIDPADNSSTTLWRNRLAKIFTSVMASRQHYTQMRYIGIANNGREIVRVNRTDDDLVTVPEPDLQEKEKEPYFRNGLNTPKGNAFFSEVTYNKEHGKITSSLTPTVRTVYPVFSEDGTRFGMIVINADYQKLLQTIVEKTSPHANLLVVNSAGDYLEYKRDTGLLDFEFHQNYTRKVSGFIPQILAAQKNEASLEDAGNFGYLVRLNLEPQKPENYLSVLKYLPKDELLQPAYDAGQTSMILTIGILFLSLITAYWFTRLFTKPLQQMTMSITRAKNKYSKLNLPAEKEDEIGDLARAFEEMTDNLHHSRQQLHAVIDNAVDGILTINERAIIQTANPACQTLFGYSSEELIGQNIRMLMPEPYHSSHDQYIANYKRTGERKIIGIGREVIAKHKDGSEFPIDLSISEYYVRDQRFFSGTVRDITERKRQEEKLRDTLAALETYTTSLERSNQELDEFAYIASHDLKEPLRGLHNHSRFLQEDYESHLDEDGKRRLSRMMYLSQRMEKLVNDLLYFSRIGRQELAIKDTNINSVIQDVSKTLEMFLEENNAHIDVDDKLPTVYCDSTRVTEVFNNLITNAVKYNDKDKKFIGIGFMKECPGPNKSLMRNVFYVRDNGKGIPQEFHDDIFRIFKRLEKAREGDNGTGAGLTFVKKIITRHNGKIWLESESGKGTTFYFTLEGMPNEQRAAA